MEALVIPVKSFSRSKMRLTGLHRSQRRELAMAMLEDILQATSGMPTFIVTNDPDARSIARRCRAVDDPRLGLNAAISAATSVAIDAGATTSLVLPCDVPLVRMSDIELLLDQADPVAIVASSDGGTNALVRRPAKCIPPLFGSNSADAHRQAARHRGLRASIIELASLTLDVDCADDLPLLADGPRHLRSVALARSFSQAPEARGHAPF